MKRKEPDLAERAFRRRRRQDSALVLPMFGIVLFATPFFGIFSRDAQIFGAPLPFVYVFSVWLFLILMAKRLSKLLMQGDEGA